MRINISALDLLKKGSKSQISMKNLGYRNACAVLYRFKLIEQTSASQYLVLEHAVGQPSIESIWNESGKEESIVAVIEYLKSKPSSTPEAIGRYVAQLFSRKWKKASWKRVGNALRQWAQWHMTSSGNNNIIPPAPGRKEVENTQLLLFDFWKTGNE